MRLFDSSVAENDCIGRRASRGLVWKSKKYMPVSCVAGGGIL